MIWRKGPISLFLMGLSSYLSTVCRKDCFFLIGMSWHSCRNQLATDVCIYFWALNPSIYMTILVTVSQSLDCLCFEVRFENGKCESSYFAVFFPKIVLVLCSLMWILESVYHFCKEISWNSDKNYIECVCQFREYCHLNIKSSNPWWHEIFFQLIKYSSIRFCSL